MGDRNRRNAGRGHSREIWTQYHTRLAQLPNKGSREARHEKVVKLTEKLRNRENISEQARQTTEILNEKEVQKSSSEANKTETQEKNLFGKERVGTENEFYENGVENKSDTVLRGKIPVESARDNGNSTKQKIESTDQGTKRIEWANTNDTNLHREPMEYEGQNNDVEPEEISTQTVDDMDIVTAWDYDEKGIDSAETTSSKPSESIATTANGQRVAKAEKDIAIISSVKIKKELVDEVAEMWDVEETQNEADGESVKSSDTATMMASLVDSEESSIEETEEEIITPWGQLQEAQNVTVSKRKSSMEEDRQKQKRLHTMSSGKISNKQMTNTETISHGRAAIRKGNTVEVQKSPTNDTQDFESTKEPTLSSTRGRSDSDEEWETIRRKNERENMKQRTNKREFREGRTKNTGKMRLIMQKSDPQTDQTIQMRGLQMMEEEQRLTTPVSIEFNLENNIAEFNVLDELETIFHKMIEIDESVKVLDTKTQKIIWEENLELPEGTKFAEVFNLREQSFRTGNRKVTLYCTLESAITINKLKYLEPMKSFIMHKNIWVKPDWYSAKVVNSPGFFVLLHPKITNKGEMVKEIKAALQKTDIDDEEQAVKEWKQNNSASERAAENCLPQFHLETSSKKWGGIQCEVLSIHCTKDDAKYLKYVLAEASSQKKLAKGVFVPTGIHLMEGKEVLTQLLTEHQDFVQQVTSIQIGGISYEEMKRESPTEERIYDLFLQCEGVHAVEPTHATSSTGQWLLVVDQQNIVPVKGYISNIQEKIYKNRGVQNNKEFRYTKSASSQGYKLVVVDRWTNRVSTYAEALRNRFDPGKMPTQADRKSSVRPMVERHKKSSGLDDTIKDNTTNYKQKAPSKWATDTRPKENEGERIDTPSREQPIQTPQKFDDTPQESNDDRGYAQSLKEKQLREMEITFQSKLDKMDSKNNQFLQSVENKINQKVDAIMDEKLNKMSDIVAELVTARILKGMANIMQRKREKEAHEVEGTANRISQPSQPPTNHSELKHQGIVKSPESRQSKLTTTERMVQELSKIENSTLPSKDPPHDTKPTGSSAKVS